MNIGFHSNQLGIRGTEVALYDYAFFNETILGNRSFIISDRNSDLQALQKFSDKFEVFLYTRFDDVDDFVRSEKIDATYFIKAGDFDGKLLKSCSNLVHSVFQYYEPHGEKYLYVSRWLSQKMTSQNDLYVPHIVSLPDNNLTYRDLLNIPDDAVVFGRYGGYEQFDLDWVVETVITFAKDNPSTFFLFMNTRPFGENLHNIIFLKPEYDLNSKVAFIDTCDAMIHARREGESFGLAIAEFLFRDKPIITFNGGTDLNHMEILQGKGHTYANPYELNEILINFNKNKIEGEYKTLVEEFSPSNVMRMFNSRFLE